MTHAEYAEEMLRQGSSEAALENVRRRLAEMVVAIDELPMNASTDAALAGLMKQYNDLKDIEDEALEVFFEGAQELPPSIALMLLRHANNTGQLDSRLDEESLLQVFKRACLEFSDGA